MINATAAQQAAAPPQALDVEAQLAGLRGLTPEQLRAAWRRYYRVPPPKGLSRDMLTRAIAYKIQEHAFGGLSKSTMRRLATLARMPDSPECRALAPYASLKSGTKLVREWGGETHTVHGGPHQPNLPLSPIGHAGRLLCALWHGCTITGGLSWIGFLIQSVL